jgi:hypothetical protein
METAAVSEETTMAQFEAQLEELVDAVRKEGLDDQAIVEVLSEVARKLREGLWKTGPAV